MKIKYRIIIIQEIFFELDNSYIYSMSVDVSICVRYSISLLNDVNDVSEFI